MKNSVLDFEINDEFIELIKLLKACGIVYTGAEAKEMVRESRVKVNGQIELRMRYKCRKNDVIETQEIKIKIC
jgi:ribosome-associated protein